MGNDHHHGHGHHGHGHGHHGHGHHGHVHVPTGEGDPRGPLAGALLLNGGYLLVEAGVGWWSGSLALLSDAAHMASDVGALALALITAQLARAASNAHRTFGWRRAEVLGGFLNGLGLLAACAWIAVEAVERLQHGPPELPGLPMLVVAFLGLLVNLGSAWWLWRGGHDDLNVRAALAHMLADALGSVGAMVAGALVMAGYPMADPVISVAVAMLVAWGTVGLLRATSRVLLQLPPENLDVDALRTTLCATTGVRSVHDLHVWTVDGRSPIVTAHLVLADDADGDATRVAAAAALDEGFAVHHATLQIERGAQPACGVPEGCGG